MDKIYFKFSWTNGSVTEDYIENWVIQVVDKDDKIYHEFYEYDIRNNEILTVEFSIPLVRAELYARFYINEPKPDNLMGERKLDINFGTDRKFIRRKGEISTFSYEPKNCKTQLEYTQCTPVCGPNRSRYMLDVLKQASDNGGIECPYDPDIYPRTVEGSTQSCESTACPDCEAGFVYAPLCACNERGESFQPLIYKIQKYPGEGGKACLHYDGYVKSITCNENTCDSKYELFSGTNYTGDRVTLGKFNTTHSLPFYPRSAKFLGSYSDDVCLRFYASGDFEGMYIEADFSSDLNSVWFPERPKSVALIKGRNAPQYSQSHIDFASWMRGKTRLVSVLGDADVVGATIKYTKRSGSSITYTKTYIYTSDGHYNFIDMDDQPDKEGWYDIKRGRGVHPLYAVNSNGQIDVITTQYQSLDKYHFIILISKE
jgi:hypothetical protein